MIPIQSSSVPKDNVVFPRLLYCDTRCSQESGQLSQACRQRSGLLTDAPKVPSGTPRCFETCHNHSHGTLVPVIRDPRYSEGQQECPPRVWYSPEIDASKFTLHILSDTPGGFQWLKYILLMYHIPCMAHVIQLALGAFMNSLGVQGRTKSWEAHERDQQFGENESIDIGKSQRLPKEGNASINKVYAMRPGLAQIIEKVRISWSIESPETADHIAEHTCCIEFADTWSSKWVHWLSKSRSVNSSTSNYGCEHRVEFDTGVE